MLRYLVVPTADIFRKWHHAFQFAENSGVPLGTFAYYAVWHVAYSEDALMDTQSLGYALAECLHDDGYDIPGHNEVPYEVMESMWEDLVMAVHELYARIHQYKGLVLHHDVPGGFVSGVAYNRFVGRQDVGITVEISTLRRAA